MRSRRRRPLLGAGEPVLKSGRGGCSAPWTVAFEHVEQIRLTSASPLRAHACAVADGEVRDAQVDRSVRRDRRGSGAAGGVRAGGQREGRARPGDPLVRGDHPGPAGVAGLACRVRGDACGDGVHRRLLEGALLHAGGRVRGAAGQRHASQACPGPQDRCDRRPVDRRGAVLRAVAAQLRATAAVSGAAGPDPLPQVADPGPDQRDQPVAQGPGGRRGEAGDRRDRRDGGVGAGDDACPDRRGGRPAGARRSGQGAVAGEAARSCARR